MVINK